MLHPVDKSWRYSQPLRDDDARDHVMYDMERTATQSRWPIAKNLIQLLE